MIRLDCKPTTFLAAGMSNRRLRRTCWLAAPIVAWLGVAGGARPVLALDQTLLRDQFQLDPVGDNLSMLLNWNQAFSAAPATDGAIINVGGVNRALLIDPTATTGPDSHVGISSKATFNQFTTNKVISTSVDILLVNEGITDSAFAATFGLGRSADANLRPRYLLAIAEGAQTVSLLRETGLGVISTLGQVSFDPGFTRHSYRFDTLIRDSSSLIEFRVYIDGQPVFTAQDTSPLPIGSLIKFGLGANFGNTAIFDEFHARLIPEPSALVLGGIAVVLAAAVLAGRRRVAAAAA